MVLFFVFSFLFVASSHAQTRDKVVIGDFSRSDLDGWDIKHFKNNTQYELVQVEDRIVLKAVSRGSASGLVKKVRVDLDKTPFLNWQWRIENRLTGLFEETAKSGDDYAARIYIVDSGGLVFWNTIALNYVWTTHAQKDTVWPSAYAGSNSMMKALRSSDDPVAVWLTQKRNIKEDFKAMFGKDIRYIDAVALMTDTDDTDNEVTALYGDIYFSAE